MEIITSHGIYIIAVSILMLGLYGVIANRNLVHKLICLGVFQAAIFLLYISVAYVYGSRFPIIKDVGNAPLVITNPLPHVLILTGIVVGVATLAVGIALALRIKETFGTLDEREIIEKE
jgi:multicomponent Na+:H+ antiporter subunit C